MWQCFAHCNLFDKEVRPSGENLIDMQAAAPIMVKLILDGNQPNLCGLDCGTPNDLIAVMEQCWESDPSCHPSS